jgi:hypothetical protein
LGGVGAKSIYSLNSNIILVKGKKERERKWKRRVLINYMEWISSA